MKIFIIMLTTKNDNICIFLKYFAQRFVHKIIGVLNIHYYRINIPDCLRNCMFTAVVKYHWMELRVATLEHSINPVRLLSIESSFNLCGIRTYFPLQIYIPGAAIHFRISCWKQPLLRETSRVRRGETTQMGLESLVICRLLGGGNGG